VVRLPERFRNNVEAISNVLITSPNGAQVRSPMSPTSSVRTARRRFRANSASAASSIGVNVKDRDLGSFVAELQQKVDAQIKLPEGYYLEWGGQFQNMERALGHLTVIIPITIAAIFFLLFLLFNSLRFATLIITVLPFASIGGIIGLFTSPASICRCRLRWGSSRCGVSPC
jgi:cobalt-zinc-cadmium resistance protein CzcA